MTIAVGFCTRDGILFCADSLYTGASKVNQQKIWGYRVDGNSPNACTLMFGIAGHEDNSKMAIEDCLHAVATCPPEERTGKRVRDLLRDEIGKIHTRYVDGRPESERDNLRFELIIGAWLPLAGGCRMFRSAGPAVTSAEPYHCVGTGYYLGDFIMKRFASRNMPLARATLLAIEAIAAAKSYDANCGGPTQFMMISNMGQISNAVPYNVHDAESYASKFDGDARTLFFQLADTASSDETFRAQLEHFIGNVNEIRRYWKKDVDPQYQRLLDLIASGAIKTAAPPDRQSPTGDPSPPQPSQESPGGSDVSE